MNNGNINVGNNVNVGVDPGWNAVMALPIQSRPALRLVQLRDGPLRPSDRVTMICPGLFALLRLTTTAGATIMSPDMWVQASSMLSLRSRREVPNRPPRSAARLQQ